MVYAAPATLISPPGEFFRLEPTPDLYVEHMIAVFREVWRVLRPDGTAWVNLGDSFYTGHSSNRTKIEGLKPKDLVGIPWHVAFALQADGWTLFVDWEIDSAAAFDA